MALIANWPIGMAPGMGLNAFFAFTVVKTMGYTWEQALGAVFISGVIFLFLTFSGIRVWLIKGIPHSLRSAIAAGIGLFLAIIALSSAGIVAAHPATKVTLGNLTSPGPLFAILGFFIIASLDALRVRGAILIGILVVTLLSMALGYNEFKGVFSAPPSLAPTLFKLDILGALHSGFVHVILVFVLVEVFDATGTLVGVAKRAGLVPEDRPNRLGALFADSSAIVAGSMLGTSSTTAYVESASGVQAGGRTGLTALVVAVLFLAALFISPLAGAVPAYATAPALLYVAGLMMRELIDIDWNDVCEATPAALTALIMPFTYSIANGIAFGFISYVVLKTATGKVRDVHPATWLVALLFVIRYAFSHRNKGRAVRHGRLRPEGSRRQRPCAGGVVPGMDCVNRADWQKRSTRRPTRLLPAGLEFVDTLPKYPSIWSPPCTLNATPPAPAPVPQQARSASPVRPRRRARGSPDERAGPHSLFDPGPGPIVQGRDAADAFRNTVAVAQQAERLGYNRFWLAEHHNINGVASSATAVLIGHVAAHTKTLRVGSGGVMLPNHAPLIIAEQFGTLETLYPGRIDLGLGRAPGSDGATQHALRRGRSGPGIPRAG